MLGEGSSKKRHVEGLQMSQSTQTVTLSKEMNELLIPYVAALVQSSDRSCCLPATVWFRGLFSAGKDCPPVAKVLQSGVVPSLLLFLTEENDPELQVEAAKALRYIASGTSVVTKVTIDQELNLTLDVLWHLLLSKDYDVVRHTCCSLAVLSGCKNVKIRQQLRESVIFELFLDLVRYPTTPLVAVGLRILGNIVRGDECLIDRIITSEVGYHLINCLYHDHVDVRKEACWVIAYVTEGNRPWKEEVFDASLIKRLVHLVKVDKYCVMEAAIRAISNATLGATPRLIGLLVSGGCIEILCSLFCSYNQEIFKVCVDGLGNILEAGEAENRNMADKNPYVDHIDKNRGWKILMGTLCKYEKKLHEKCFEILKRYRPDILHVNYNYGYAGDDEEYY